MVWTAEKQKQLRALGFEYVKDSDKWIRHCPNHDEFVRATGDFLYWFDMKARDGGYIRGSNKWPIMHFDALVIFLKALRYLEKELGE
jgi:hypothetical protein